MYNFRIKTIGDVKVPFKYTTMEWYDYQNEYPENECRYCGEPCEKTYCNKQCERADED